MLNHYQITFRGGLNIGIWNGILRQLFDMGIEYKTIEKLSPTKKGAGDFKWFSCIIFDTEKHIDIKLLISKQLIYEVK